MPGSALPSRIPLPKGWPRQVRSAVVHAVSMARVSLTIARAHAEHHFDARIRLLTENDRLRHEVFFKEEVRIKDSRMERIPPEDRPQEHQTGVDSKQVLALSNPASHSTADRRPRSAIPAAWQ